MSARRARTSSGGRDWASVIAPLRSCLEERVAGRAPRYAPPPTLPEPLARLAARFGLGAFDCGVLILCAAVEWDPQVAALCSALQGDSTRRWASYGLAVDVIADGTWTRLSPNCALRRWRLVDVSPGAGIRSARLCVDERMLLYLCDLEQPEARLEGLIRPVVVAAAARSPGVEAAVEAWRQARSLGACPVIQLPSDAQEDPAATAAAVCGSLALRLQRIDGGAIPLQFAEREALARLWEREALLTNAALLVEAAELDEAARLARVRPFLESLQGLAFVVGDLAQLDRPLLRMEAAADDAARTAAHWRRELGAAAAPLNGQLEALSHQFQLRPAAIRRVAARATGRSAEEVGTNLWNACRAEARGELDMLGQRIEPRASWEDLVLPPAQTAALRTLTLHLHGRQRVYQEWGFAQKSARGLGIAALFTGRSGTGKTLAAEVIARELRLDLYRIDLAATVSKYIGETEKNLRRVFDAAEAGGAILLFDEADALFGSRSEVRDSRDRYANLEVAYLLQRVETYRGLAILTTNLKQAIDSAFLRRIRFVVEFPFPDEEARSAIWERVFPAQTPREGLRLERLARLNLSGGNIRNMALNAAFLAAGANEPVRMSHLLRAAEAEYLKMEKPLPRADVRDWV